MSTHDLYPNRAERPNRALTGAPAEWISRYRDRSAARTRARLTSVRNRRRLARWLRETAARAGDPDPFARRHSVLLHYRAAAVRTEMLQIAATLEHAHDPDPECITLLQNLLANEAGNSPLYNRHLPAADLEAIVRRIRGGLETYAADLVNAEDKHAWPEHP
jgi:hypothetical protein